MQINVSQIATPYEFDSKGIPDVARFRRLVGKVHCGGFTLIEIAIVIAILGALVAMAIPAYTNALYNARIARAIGDIRAVEKDVVTYEAANGKVPDTLADVGREGLLDPWGFPYAYLSFANAKKGKPRKDRFLVPLNSTFDLYSVGRDGLSQESLQAKQSWDDIVRANDGGYVGLAAAY